MKKLILLIALFCSTLCYAQSPSNIGRMYDDKPYIPHEMEGCFNLDDAIAAATKLNKPILVDVTGFANNNSREMEQVVWGNERILTMLKNDFVICVLYIDDRSTDEDGQRIGMKNAKLVDERWGIVSMPAYIILSPDGERVLAGPYGYNTDIDSYVSFLEEGLAKL